MGSGTLNTELLSAFPNVNLRMTASPFEQQKAKLSPECFRHIMTELVRLNPYKPRLLNNHYLVVAIDGSDFSMPFNPKSQNIIHENTDHPYCQVHVNALYDILNKLYLDLNFQPTAKMDERAAAVELLKTLDKKGADFLVLMDRGYSALNMFETCNRLKHCYYAIRTKSGNGALKGIGALANEETDIDMCCPVTTSKTLFDEIPNVYYVKHARRPYKKSYSKYSRYQKWDFERYCKVKFRVCKFRINPPGHKDEWEVLITNLDRKEFPLSKMKEIYHLRWGIETSFREVKYDLSGIQFHSKKDQFVYMEIYAHFTMYNAASLSLRSAPKVPSKRKLHYKQDFRMVCKSWIESFRSGSFSDESFTQLILNIQSYEASVRQDRSYPRSLRTIGAIGLGYRLSV